MEEIAYVCRNCKNQVSMERHRIGKTTIQNYTDFRELVNVFQKPAEKTLNNFRKVHCCKNCRRELGGDRLMVPQKDNFFMNLSSLAIRKGSQFFDAVTEQEIDLRLPDSGAQASGPKTRVSLNEQVPQVKKKESAMVEQRTLDKKRKAELVKTAEDVKQSWDAFQSANPKRKR